MDNKFIEALYAIGDKAETNRAPIANIKKGASDPATNYEVMKYLGKFFPEDDEKGNHRDRVYLVTASLFSLFPRKKDEERKAGNLGEILRRVKSKLGEDAGGSFEIRVNRLLKCHSDDLPKLLASMFRYLKSMDVGTIDYEQLFKDIQNWDNSSQFVQKRIARDFWGYFPEKTDNNNDKKNENNN